ncbi:ribosome recycling factor [Croceifilum oryzae]|uniref:Ribosome recycling factor n=1 Tax=Croceifilum oryzae TaxID=1553429 RepID=A0AAJ1TIQ7_9BACL|nr:hypothetical protein [Croceifilum oryzae]MDQ0416734.1 ribosome recycling factor [Croceifilum oryzae]
MEGDFRPDATYNFGNTTINVFAPKITEEERQKRLEEIKQLIMKLRISNEVLQEECLYQGKNSSQKCGQACC